MKISKEIGDKAIVRELGERLARTRLERNLTQAELAEQAGIAKRTLERIEAGGAAQLDSLALFDSARQRPIPISLYLPAVMAAIKHQPLVILSYGYNANLPGASILYLPYQRPGDKRLFCGQHST